MTNIPDGLPVLSHGAHSKPSDGACVMEYVSVLAGEEFTDRPACTHPLLGTAAQVVNDRLTVAERHLLVPFIGRLIGTSDISQPMKSRLLLNAQLAAWVALYALPAPAAPHQKVMRTKIARWLDTPNDKNAAAVASMARAFRLNPAFPNYVDYTLVWAKDCIMDRIGTFLPHAAQQGVGSAFHLRMELSGGKGGVETLGGLLDFHDHITGHQPRELETAELRELAGAVA